MTSDQLRALRAQLDLAEQDYRDLKVVGEQLARLGGAIVTALGVAESRFEGIDARLKALRDALAAAEATTVVEELARDG